MSQGKPLRGAGLLYFRQGRLITISNESGHYKPTLKEMLNAIQWFQYQYQAQSDILFEDHSEQNSNIPLNGIQYFKISTDKQQKLWSMELIEPSQLFACLSTLVKNVDNFFFDFFYKPAKDEIPPYSNTQELPYNDKPTHSYSSTSTEPLVADLPNLPRHLATLTSLPKLKNGNSRFNGITRPLKLHIKSR